jgi:uncharacterized hydrophobic protein (TIGR00271 family)
MMNFYQWLKSQLMETYRGYKTKKVSEYEYKRFHKILSLESEWNLNFFVLVVTSCLIATFGLVSNSTAVIIGAMIVAPLMLPIRGLALASLEGDLELFKKALFALVGATLLALFLSWSIGTIARIPEFGSEVLARTEPNLVDLGIAVTAGFVSGFAKVRKGINDALAGTAIAVALMPPLCVIGLSLSQGLYQYGLGAFLLYLTNLLGICLACMIVFIIAGYARISHALGWIAGLTLLLLIPLGTSFVRLVIQEQISYRITRLLINETVTIGQNVDQVKIKIDWSQKPPEILIQLSTDKIVTPNQVRLVENFLEERVGKRFVCTIFVTQFKRVTSQDPEIISPIPDSLELNKPPKLNN